MTVFISRGGAAYRGIEALRRGPLRTSALAAAMGIPQTGRVHAYMRWALDAGAVEIVERGRGGPGKAETLWALGDTPAELEGQPVNRPSRARVAPASSVFGWRP